ncbi:MAG: hypothetical protein COS89_08645 [Deltaproteobacteria bacterium CG07_land_8_20_14_0_80_38_7]|nr:MAG: hypothetical protein COS89_08645 [Deltaproteobacteria bacterium CG07_land_8_20_14_0_80_38_7]
MEFFNPLKPVTSANLTLADFFTTQLPNYHIIHLDGDLKDILDQAKLDKPAIKIDINFLPVDFQKLKDMSVRPAEVSLLILTTKDVGGELKKDSILDELIVMFDMGDAPKLLLDRGASRAKIITITKQPFTGTFFQASLRLSMQFYIKA